MRESKIYSFTSNFNNYDTLYKYAAILENIGNVTLVPLNLRRILPDAKIYDEALASRNNMDLKDLRRKRIDMSDELIVYLNGKDVPCIAYETIMDIIYAHEKKIDISIAYENITLDEVVDNIISATLGNIKIDIAGSRNIGLNGGYDISLTKINITTNIVI